MKTFTPSLRHWSALLVLALLLPGLAVAQPMRGAFAEDRAAARLAYALELTDAQEAQLEEVLAEYDGPRATWEVAALFQRTLSAEQKAMLWQRPQPGDGAGFRGPRGDRGGMRGDRGNRPDRDELQQMRQERRQAMQQARDEVLGLTSEQAEALDAFRQQRRTGPPQLPDEVREALDPRQEMVQIHHALMRHMMRGAARHHGPHHRGSCCW